eukprot:COSAG03_NODE_12716_length_534_cov_1.531034_1_plen_134_part_10
MTGVTSTFHPVTADTIVQRFVQTALLHLSMVRRCVRPYATGGDYGGTIFSSGERYDPAADAWSPIASMGTTRVMHTAAVVDGLLYAIGGNRGSGERYDPAANAWSPIAFLGSAQSTLNPSNSRATDGIHDSRVK